MLNDYQEFLKSKHLISEAAGIGSEGYVAIKQGRHFIGIELKELYVKAAVRNLQRAESEASSQGKLF